MKRMKLYRSIVIGLCICFSIIWGQNTIQQNKGKCFASEIDFMSKEFLSRAAEDITKAARLPKMVDKHTEFTRVTAERGFLIYHYTLIYLTAKDIKKNKFLPIIKKNMQSMICNHDVSSYLMKQGISFGCLFYSKDGRLIESISIIPEECGH
jgi:hypothetical protein